MPTLSQTDLDNAMRDAQDLGKFMNDAAGTVATRTGGTIPNLKALIATVEGQVLGTTVQKTTAGNLTITTERHVLIDKTVAEATTVTFPTAASRNGLPITVVNLGTNDYIANPTTIQLSGSDTFEFGGTSYVMDGQRQALEFWPLPDDSGYYIKG